LNKYFAKKTEVDGIKFDSKKEAQFYLKLKELEQKGEIKNIERQVPYELQESFKFNGETYRKIEYKADFRYVTTKDNKIHVVDVKSPYTRKDKVYRLKKKMFVKKYNIELEEK
jgi:hypothetical protein